MKQRTIWTGLLTVVIAAVASAYHSTEATQADDYSEIEKLVKSVAQEATSSGSADGLAVLVAVGSEVHVRSAFGRTSEHQDANHAYRVGGLLPAFISAAALQLADQEKLDLDQRLGEFFPKLEDLKDVRIRQLLNHTSGLADCSGFLDEEELSVEKLVPWLVERELDTDPGSCFSLSMTNLVLAGAVVEKAAGSDLATYLAEVVFGPNEMDATQWCWEGPKVDANSVSGVDSPGGLISVPDLAGVHSAAGLCSTVDDLFRWQRALIERRLLEDESYAAFTNATSLSDGSKSFSGCGSYVMQLGEFEGFAFGGTLAGFTAHVAYYPDYELSIILLAEGDEAPLRSLERKMARAVLDIDPLEVRDLPLEPGEKERYLGAYFIGCTQILIQEAHDGTHLEAAWPSDRNLELLYQGRHTFVSSDDSEVSLTFEMDGDHAGAFVLQERGTETRAKRMR